jgi:hypothetical protein
VPAEPGDSDDRLLEVLGEVLDTIEAPSGTAVDSAAQLIALRQLDGDLMELVADSIESSLAQRSVDAGRLLRFEGFGCQIEIDAHFGDGLITVQLTPGGVSEVTTVTAATTATLNSDELGRFREEIGVRGLRRWCVRFPDGRIVVTPIVRL